MIRPILNARLDGASTIPATGTLTAASGSTVDLSLATVTLPASITSTFFDFKGNQSASGDPNYPTGAKGDVYYISVAGKVGGASGKTVTVGDMLICSADNAGGTEASVGTSWFVTESNLDMTNVAITGGSITGITDITVADGGTGRSTGTTAYALVATGTTATGAQQTLASGGTTEVLVGGGASALPVWTTATGSGAPVRGTSPTITTPVITNINPGANFTLTNNGVSVLTSKNTGAVVNTLVLDNGSVGIGTSSPTATGGNKLHVYESTAASIRATVEAGNTGYNSAIRLISAKDWFVQGNGNLASNPGRLSFIQNTDSVTPLELSSSQGIVFTKTITAAATTGAQTINKTSGSVNFAAAATSLVVTNSMCATSSVIHCTIATNDATAADVKAVAAAGSFTIYLTTAPTAETRVNFLITN